MSASKRALEERGVFDSIDQIRRDRFWDDDQQIGYRDPPSMRESRDKTEKPAPEPEGDAGAGD